MSELTLRVVAAVANLPLHILSLFDLGRRFEVAMSPFVLGHSGCPGSAFYTLEFPRLFNARDIATDSLHFVASATKFTRPPAHLTRKLVSAAAWRGVCGQFLSANCGQVRSRSWLPGNFHISYFVAYDSNNSGCECGLEDTDMSGQVVRSKGH